MKLLDTLANAFPVWVLVACGLALVRPELFTWFRGNAIVVGLAVIMLGMGLTLSIEVGMQNSGLGVVFAQRHFSTDPLAAVPCAISSVVHSCLGSLLAGWWRLRPAGSGCPIPTDAP